MVNADIRSAEVIKRLAGLDYPSVAEVGVFRGDMSRRLLYRMNLHLLMVDPWGTVKATDSYIASGDPMATMTPEQWTEVKDAAIGQTLWASDRVRVFEGASMEAAKVFHKERFDCVFLDAAHDYENVAKDISAWWPLVADGGWLGGHDYGREEFGVTEAVNDFAEESGAEVQLGGNYCWFIRKC